MGYTPKERGHQGTPGGMERHVVRVGLDLDSPTTYLTPEVDVNNGKAVLYDKHVHSRSWKRDHDGPHAIMEGPLAIMEGPLAIDSRS